MYTHYYEPKKSIDDDAWNKICLDAKKMIKFYKENDILIESNEPSGVIVSNKKGYININGIGDDSYETFLVEKKPLSNFNFCKTNRNNYDIVVVSILLILQYHASNAINISSDGDFNDWKDAMTNNAKVLGHAFELPISMSNEESHLYTKELAVKLYEKEVSQAMEKQNTIADVLENSKSRLKI